MRWVAGAAALAVLLAWGPRELFAQAYPGYPYGGQYVPQYAAPQSAYGQPYAQQPYAQQPYGQTYPQPAYRSPQTNSQQPYGQPAYGSQSGYGQQAYTQQPYAPQYQAPMQAYPQQANVQQPLNADQLEQLVAPIALYPDTLVAQVLAASTYPAQVQSADGWLRAQGNASPYQIAGGADVQNWDPSVKALTAFPQVLAELDRNLQWTSDLGNVYYNQPQDVLEAVQVMRQRAQAAGNLQSSPQEQVNYDAGAIELAPPNPQMVYVPQYNPWSVYGDPVQPYPGFSLLSAVGSFFTSALGSTPLQYGLGIALAAFDHTPWGWLSWGLSWLTHAILFDHSNYTSHSATVANWGLLRGGSWAYSGQRGGLAQGNGRSPERIAENRSGYGSANQSYRPTVEAYNRAPAPISRTQAYSPESRLAYGPGVYNGTDRGFGGREQAAASYRAPSVDFQRGDLAARSTSGFNSFRPSEKVEKPEKSGGFHLFGSGSHEPKMSASNSFSSERSFSGKAPKMPSGGKSFSGGHSSGGHSSGHGSTHHR